MNDFKINAYYVSYEVRTKPLYSFISASPFKLLKHVATVLQQLM
jgi:hypothetical protein